MSTTKANDNIQTVMNELKSSVKANSNIIKMFSKNVPMSAAAEQIVYQKLIQSLKYELFLELERAKELVKPKHPKWEIFKMMCKHPVYLFYGVMALLGMRISALRNKCKKWLQTLN